MPHIIDHARPAPKARQDREFFIQPVSDTLALFAFDEVHQDAAKALGVQQGDLERRDPGRLTGPIRA
jgi:hypothetical protein